MGMSFPEATRTSWRVADRIKFFNALTSLLPQLDSYEKAEIRKRLLRNDPEYFEIAGYLSDGSEDEPDFIVVFQNQEAFVDFVRSETTNRSQIIIENLLGKDMPLIQKRSLTEKDWLKRLEVLDSLS